MKKKTKAIKHKNDEITSYITYGCKIEPNEKRFGPCHARIDLIESTPIQDQVPSKQVTLKVLIDDKCNCNLSNHQKEGLPSAISEKILKILDNGLHLQNQQIVLLVMNDISNDIDIDGRSHHHSYIKTGNDRQKLKQQILGKIKREKKKQKQRGLNKSIHFVAHLVHFKEKHTFIPPNEPNTNLHDEAKVKEFGTQLYDQNKLRVAYTEDTTYPRFEAYRCFTVLDPKQIQSDKNTSATENQLYKRIDDLVAKNRRKYINEGNIYDTTTVITSLALLWNVCEMKRHSFKIMASCDGTDALLPNNDQTLMFGCFSINRYGKRSFRPIIVAIGRGEREEIFCVLLVALQKYSRLLFNIVDINFVGGVTSDHSYAFVNGCRIAFPNTNTHQCYPVSCKILLIF